MTEAVPPNFPPVGPAHPQQTSKDHSVTTLSTNDLFNDNASFNSQSRANQSTTDHPPAAKVLANGDSNTLRILCARLHSRITAFLDENVKSARLQAVQAQTRLSLKIIQEALDRYPYYVPLLPSPPKPLGFTFLTPPAPTAYPLSPSPTTVERIVLSS